MPVDTKAYREAAELAELSQDDVYLLITDELKTDAFYADHRNEQQRIVDAKQWFARAKDILKQLLCGSALEVLHSEPKTKLEKILLICAVGDVISGAELGVSPFTAAALTISYGLRTLCNE